MMTARSDQIGDLLGSLGIHSDNPGAFNGGWLEVDSTDDLEFYEKLREDGTLNRFW